MTNAVSIAQYGTNNPSWRNRIINGGQGIWQRGTSFSGTAGQYVQDRWLVYAPSGTFGSARSTDVPAGFQYSAELTGTNPSLTQRIESVNCLDLAGGSVTVSFWAKSTSGTQGLFVALQNPSATDNWSSVTDFASTTVSASPSSSWTYYTVTFTNLPVGVANGLGLVIGRAVGGATTTRITGVQLEAGSVATPFERRPYGIELALCQRYYQFLGGTIDQSIGSGIPVTSSQSYSFVPFICAMRAAPSVSFSNIYFTDSASYSSTISAIANSQIGTTSMRIAFNSSAVMTTYRPGMLGVGATGGGLSLSSEL